MFPRFRFSWGGGGGGGGGYGLTLAKKNRIYVRDLMN